MISSILLSFSLLFMTPATRATFMAAAANSTTHHVHKHNNYKSGSFVTDEFVDHWGHYKLANRKGYSDVADVITYRVNDKESDTCITVTLCNVLYNSEEYLQNVDSIRFIFKNNQSDYWTEVLDGNHTFGLSDALERRLKVKDFTNIKVYLNNGNELFYDADNGHNVLLRYVTYISDDVDEDDIDEEWENMSRGEKVLTVFMVIMLVISFFLLMFVVVKLIIDIICDYLRKKYKK